MSMRRTSGICLALAVILVGGICVAPAVIGMAQMPVKKPAEEQLKIEAPKQVNAGETFKVTVKDEAGKPVAGAEVKLLPSAKQMPKKFGSSMAVAMAKLPVKEPMKKPANEMNVVAKAKTNENGVATLEAPKVLKKTVMTIEATSGTQKGTADITALPEKNKVIRW